MPEQKVMGIYSYPKSGNTWVRQIMASVMGIAKDELSKYIPDIHQGPIAVNPIKRDDIDYYLYKSHTDSEIRNNRGKVLINDIIVHIRRHPLDVFISYLNFISNNVTGDAPIRFESVDKIAGTELFSAYFISFMMSGALQPTFKPAGSWFVSNKYWLERANKPIEGSSKVHSIKYEDLVNKGASELSFLTTFLSIDENAIDLAMKEADRRTPIDGKFFWKRKIGTYSEYLTKEQIDLFWRIRGDHARQLGYDRE